MSQLQVGAAKNTKKCLYACIFNVKQDLGTIFSLSLP